MLSEIEKDALTELVNIAVSGSAVRLRAMVGSEVRLTVPAVSIIESGGASRAFEALGLTRLLAVRQNFFGRLQGQTLLVFPDGNQAELVRAVAGAELGQAELDALTEDALGEIGNVLLLGFLSSVGTMLEVTFEVSVPTVAITGAADIFAPEAENVALLIYVNFSISGREVRGYFGLVLGLETFAVLREILAIFIARISA